MTCGHHIQVLHEAIFFENLSLMNFSQFSVFGHESLVFGDSLSMQGVEAILFRRVDRGH